MKCKHDSKVAGWLSVVTGIALILHISSHLLPLLLIATPESKMLTLLEHPAFTVLALGFIPLMFYHLWRDNRIHRQFHILEEECETAKSVVRWISIAYDTEYAKKKPNWATFSVKCRMVLKGVDDIPDHKKVHGSEKV